MRFTLEATTREDLIAEIATFVERRAQSMKVLAGVSRTAKERHACNAGAEVLYDISGDIRAMTLESP